MSDSTPHEPSDSFGESSVDPQSVEGLFLTALSKSTPQEREEFLAEACGDDSERRRRIEALLRAYDDAGSFLDKPAAGVPTEIDPQNFEFLEPSDDPGLLGMLGPYEIYEVIGRGGMGIVFRARDPKLNRVVAVKVLAPELAANPNAKRRFVREAQAGAAISHPHVVTIHAVDEDEKIPYLVMECIVGQSLQQKLDKAGSLRLTEILRIIKQVGEGLTAAHKQGLIHRDIKPANILLENGVERVKITDFGLARAVDDVSVTRTGEVAGSPQFMSPEQALGERVDQRSDLFSLGCVMYAMCAGRSPFRATSIAAAIRRVCDDHPRPIEEINPEVPEWLIAIIEKLLDKNSDERFQSADELVDVLEGHLAGVQGMAQGLPSPRSETIAPSPASTKVSDRSTNQSRKPISPFWYVAALVCLISVASLLANINSMELPDGRRELLAMYFVAMKTMFVFLVGTCVFVGLKLVQNLKLHADDNVKTEPVQTQEFMSQVSADERPLLERLSSSLMRLALLGPVTMLAGLCLWAMMPTMIEGRAVQYIIMGIGPVLFGAALIGWLGTHLQRVEWGLEAYYKGVVSNFLALLLPLVWIVGIPTGLASLWVLNQKNVIKFYRRKGEGEPVSVPIPKFLLDIGTFAGAILTSLLAFLIGDDSLFNFVDVVEAGTVVLGLIIFVLPFRGELFRGRFSRDFAICSAGLLLTGFVYWLFRPGQVSVGVMGSLEVAIICLITFVLIGIPAILIWRFLIQPSLKETPTEQIPLAQTKSVVPLQMWSVGKRLLFGLGIGVAFISLQLLVPQVQKKILPTGTLTIHHSGGIKPVDVRIDGKQVFILKQSGVRTDITGLKHGLRKIHISMQGDAENLVRSEQYQINIRPGGNQEITLRLPVKMNAGMELGPASKEYGGLILEIPDPDLSVLLMRFDSNDVGFRGNFFAAGEHQVPAGKYQVVALDFLAGWLLDVKSDRRNQQSYDKVYETIDNIYGREEGDYGDMGSGGGAVGTSGIGGVNLNSRPEFYDRNSGNWSLIQYSIGNIEIKPGEFESVVAKRDLNAIALHHEEFIEGKFYRFLWSGKKYSFSAMQASVIQELLQAYADGISEVKESAVLETLEEHRDEPITSLKSIFNDGKHPGWLQLIAWTKHGEDASLNLTKLITKQKPAMSTSGFGGPSGTFPQSKVTGAVILTQIVSQLTVAVSLNEIGPFQTLSEQTTSLPVGKYFVKVFDKSYGWGSTKSRGSVAPPTYNGEQFVVKKGEFTDFVISRNWKKLAEQEPMLMEGFYPFVWDGNNYVLSKEQAKIVQQLFNAFANGKIAVEASTLVKSEDALEEIKRIFNSGNHPAWGSLLFSLGIDRLQLNMDFSNRHPAYSIPEDLQLLKLTYGSFNQKSDRKNKGIGQQVDVLVLLEKTDRNESAIPLIQNAAICQSSKVLFGSDNGWILVTKKQAEAYELAKQHGRIVHQWGEILSEFPQPVLNQKSYDQLKAKIKEESSTKDEDSGAQPLPVPEKE